MSQRMKGYSNNINMETIACEKFVTRMLNKEKIVASGTALLAQKTKEKTMTKPITQNQNQLTKFRQMVRQQHNVSSARHGRSPNRSSHDRIIHYADDPVVEVTVKTTNPHQRSRSTTVNREPWGNLLKQQRSGDKMSVFGNFDPLRTLHFLAKELQYQLQNVLPEDCTIQQMLDDMKDALKRIPPEVASSVHLQQAIDLLPSRKSSSESENLTRKVSTITVCTQTPANADKEENEKLKRLMEESTLKLEASCRQMELICTQLKNEKDAIERCLLDERIKVSSLEQRIAEINEERAKECEQFNSKIKSLEDEKEKLERDLKDASNKHESQVATIEADLKSQLVDARSAKFNLEQELCKAKHQLRLSAIEKDKYVAILSVRDKQINEIRNEMAQLQEVVNEQLLELHNSAFQTVPSNDNIGTGYPNEKNEGKGNVTFIGDSTISSIYSQDHQPCGTKSNHSFRDLPSGDVDLTIVLKDIPEGLTNDIDYNNENYVERIDSQCSIRSMMSEIKKTAYAVASNSKDRSYMNLLNGI